MRRSNSSSSESPLSESESHENEELFRKLYQKQLKKAQEKSKREKIRNAANLQNVPIQIEERNNGGLVTNQIKIEQKMIPKVMKIKYDHEERQRSRDKEKPSTIKWFIYESLPNIDYSNKLDGKLKNLPILKKKDQILSKIIKNQVVLITGDTGCGKSTQVPRLLYQYLKKVERNQKIVCVQPRRLAVTYLKSSLEHQIGERNLIGYQIGMKACFNAQNKIVFMTNGIFLQRLVHSTSQLMSEYPFIILDEVHERDIDTDFILTAIKRVIRQYPMARIILMSATIDNDLFRYYFAQDHIDDFLSDQNYYKKIIKIQQLQERKKKKDQDEDDYYNSDDQKKKKEVYKLEALKFLKSKYPCPAINVNQPGNYNRSYFYLDTLKDFIRRDFRLRWGSIIFSQKYPNTHKQLFQIVAVIIQQIYDNSQTYRDVSSQAILIFMPGLAQIQSLSQSITVFFGRQKASKYFQIIHVHSTILTEDIERRLQVPNKNKIKIIIATNIAESSITVKGVKYVIDFCLTKEIRFDMKSKMQNLQLVWASQASCKQRAGRTGRVCDGYIFRLLQQKFYNGLNQYSTPEIQRSSLDKLILRIKMTHENQTGNLFQDPAQVLGTCIQPPLLQNIQSAISSLIFCGGLQKKGDNWCITTLGRLYVDIPIDISYCKMLIISMLFGTYEDILILVSILSQNKNPFKKKEIDRNFVQYYQIMENSQLCDFYSLVKAFKKQRQVNNQDRYKRRNLRFDIVNETRNTMDDIQKRIQKKKELFNLDELYDRHFFAEEDYYFRFKMTIIAGFIDKFILVKAPIYDDKQEKRVKYMKRFNISNKNTVVLLNSNVIIKPQMSNPQAQQKNVRHWKGVLRRNLNIESANITLGNGLSYIHFQDQKQLNKLLFIKYMYSNNKQIVEQKNKKSSEDAQKINMVDMLTCLGDIDHMQQGMPVTFYKQNKITIDHHSLNRVINVNQGVKNKYLVTNSIMLQGSRLKCNFTSLLPQNIAHIQVVSHMLFYPFVVVASNKKNKQFQYLYLKKKHRVKVDYLLTPKQISQANQIRAILRSVFELQQNVGDFRLQFYQKMRKFVYKKRREIINEQKWEDQYFKQVKGLNVRVSQLQNLETSQKNKKQMQQIDEEKPQENNQQQDKSKRFMNQIQIPDLDKSFFADYNSSSYQQRIKNYNDWKIKKLMQIQQLQDYAVDHDAYLCCGGYMDKNFKRCGIKLCKLQKIGNIQEDIYRSLYQVIQENVCKAQFDQNNYFCQHLMDLYLEKDYSLYSCTNGHIFGMKFNGQLKVKILVFSQLLVVYPNIQDPTEQCQFEKLQIREWKKKADQSAKRKLKSPVDLHCIACDQNINSKNFQDLESHIRQLSHQKNKQLLKRSTEIAQKQKMEIEEVIISSQDKKSDQDWKNKQIEY